MLLTAENEYQIPVESKYFTLKEQLGFFVVVSVWLGFM